MKTIGARIQFARERFQDPPMTRQDLADAMGVSKPAVAQWESPKSPKAPDRKKIPKLAAVLKVRLEWLLTGEGTMEPSAEPAPISGGPLDRDLLYRVVVALERYFEDEGEEMDPETKGETVLAVYDYAESIGAPEEIDISGIRSLLKLARQKQRSRQ